MGENLDGRPDLLRGNLALPGGGARFGLGHLRIGGLPGGGHRSGPFQVSASFVLKCARGRCNHEGGA